ncbi:hypothetical protein N9P01_01390 [Gammaproteobacteria bacterium]|nr:hypothetical protein [Gammaproteobacteria bacterium]
MKSFIFLCIALLLASCGTTTTMEREYTTPSNNFEYKLTCELGSKIYYIHLLPPKDRKSWVMQVDGLSEYDLESKIYKSFIHARKYGQKVWIPKMGYKVGTSNIRFAFLNGYLSLNTLNMKTYFTATYRGESVSGICYEGYKIYEKSLVI